MFNFNLKNAEIFQAVKQEKKPEFKLAGLLKKLFFALFIVLVLFFLYGRFSGSLSEKSQNLSLGFSILFLVLSSVNWLEESFLNSKLKKPKLKVKIEEAIQNPEQYNLAEFLSFDAAKAVDSSIKLTKTKNFPEINSSILFYCLISNNQNLNFIFNRALLNIKEIQKILEDNFKIYKTSYNLVKKFSHTIEYSKDFQETIYESLRTAQKKGHQRIEVGDILTGLAKCDLIFKKILIAARLKPEDIENLTSWLESLEEKIEERKKFWEWKNLIKKGSLAKEWAAGYTVTLDKFSIDLSKLVRIQGFPEIIGHQKEITEMERILARQESCNDPLIVGEAGSGRKSMILALAQKSVLGESLPDVNYKRVVQLDLPSLLAQAETADETESLLDTIFREIVSAGNIILVIDEFHNFVGKMTGPGAVDISGILTSYISSPAFQVIAITTFEGLHRNIETKPSLLTFFEKIEVSEISEEETLILLERLALGLEGKYKRLISYPALRDVINLCDKYLPAIPFPEKAMDLLEETMVHLAQSKKKILLPKHVAQIITEKTQIPVGEIETEEKETLLNLENLIHQKIVNQNEAVNEISTALRRARAEVSVRKKPMGTFLFLGPTGVGKTETAKALTEIYFGSEKKMIRLDMSEFQTVSDIARLIGSAEENGLLTTPVRENPFSLVLLDEIEKAHPNILNLFLQVLDEGNLTDGLGRKTDFKNTIIICTSNAGSELIWKEIRLNKELAIIKENLLDYLFENGIFRPEFINRFDATVIFRPLTKQNFLDIAEISLQSLKKNLQKKDIEFIITPELKEKIAELSYSEIFGGRELKRVIADKVENPIAEAILKEELRRGNRFKIEPENFKVVII